MAHRRRPLSPLRFDILRNLGHGSRHRSLLVILLILVLLTPLYVFKISSYMIDIDVDLTAGQRFLAGEMLYQRADGHYQFKYAPAYALFISPLSSLPRPVARAVTFYGVAACLLALLALSGRILSDDRLPVRLYVLTLLVQVKFYGRELELGQVNALMVLLLLLMLLQMKRGRDILAGVLLALAAVIKPHPLVFLPYLAVRRKLTVLVTATAVHAVTMVLPVLRYGLDGTLDLYRAWYTTLSQSTPSLLDTTDNVSLFGFLTKWFGADMKGLTVVALGLGAVLYLALLGATLARPRNELQTTATEAAVLLVLMPLLSPQGWDYTFLSSTLGVMILLQAYPTFSRWQRTVSVTLLVLIGGSVYDLIGVRLYTWFMETSVLTVCFVGLILLLLWLRIRGPAACPVTSS